MVRKNIIKSNQNSEKSFWGIQQDLVRIATEKEVPVTEVIDNLLDDLQNFRNSNYEKKIKDITMSETLSDAALNSFKEYLIKFKKRLLKEKAKEEDKSKKGNRLTWKQMQEEINKTVLQEENMTEKDVIEALIKDISQGNDKYNFTKKEEKSTLKKLNRRLKEISEQEKEEKRKIEEEKNKVEEAILQVEKIVDREYKEGNIKNKANYLSSIKDTIRLDSKVEKTVKEKIISELDLKIKEEKDNIYFEQVKKFTNSFKFLKDYPEVIRAREGSTKINKFTDLEAYERFCNLREKLQKEYNEYKGINNILNGNKQEISDTDKRILIARKEVIEKEHEVIR